MSRHSFWRELKRRHVYRVAAAYVVVGWLLIEGATQIVPYFHIPDWSVRLLVLLVLAGFPIALVLAWAFDATPAGIRRTDADGEPVLRRSRGGTWMVGIAGLALALLVGLGYAWWHGSAHPGAASTTTSVAPEPARPVAPVSITNVATASSISAKSIAVLPFENLSTDKANAYFADGMQDLILTKLADIGELQVVSRTSTMKYASHPDDLKTVGKQLGVATVLEGSVQKAGNQVLINVQLIDTRTDHHLWAQSYQRTLDNIFGVEGEVAEKIASALKAHLTPKETSELARVGTHNKKALDAYLRASFYGRKFLSTGSMDDWRQSLDYLKKAVAIDPGFVDAWTYLALTYARFPQYHRQQREAVERALQLAPENAEAHRQLAFLYFREGKLAQALAEARRAVELDPNSPAIRAGLASVQANAGQFEAAIANYRKARSMKGGHSMAPSFQVFAMVQARQYAEARDLMRSYLAGHPDNLLVVSQLVDTELAGWGDIKAARSALQVATTPPSQSALMAQASFDVDWYARDYAKALKMMQGVPANLFKNDTPRALYLGWAQQKLGRKDEARAAFAQARDSVRQWLQRLPDDAHLHASLALALSGLGQHDQAIREAHRSMALASNAYGHTSAIVTAAQVEAAAGDADAAISKLRDLLQQPAGWDVSVPLLKLDPAWDPLRKDPRFQALLKSHAADDTTVPAEAGSG